MALSGNLGFVPLDEVLRLLMRSDQRGSVEVRGEDIRGRIFIGKKGISLATIAEDRDLHKHLVNSGYVDDAFLRKVVSGESTFSDLGEREGSVIDLIREITVESLYHLTEKGATFEVAEDATSPYSSPRPFELEAALDDARRRADEWSTVHSAIGDLDRTIRMNREPGDGEEIKISREAWRVLCELGSGASVSSLAERLGTTEFWIARVAADMAEQRLLVLAEEEEPAPAAAPQRAEAEPGPHESWWVEPKDVEPYEESPAAEYETPAAEYETPAAEYETPAAEYETPAAEETETPAAAEPTGRFGVFGSTVAPQTSVPSEESHVASDAEGYQGQEYQPVEYEAQTSESVAETAPAAQAEGVEEDTEAFLEKVFSQLEVNGQVDVEEEGHGLLRRRRMGSVLKEIDEG